MSNKLTTYKGTEKDMKSPYSRKMSYRAACYVSASPISS